jgi:hypothetical protein
LASWSWECSRRNAASTSIALDEHGSPIDYARRRALFTGPASVTLDLDA